MLPLKGIVKETYATLWGERLNILKRSLLPIFATAIVAYLITSDNAAHILVVIPLYVIAAVIFCSYFVSWFRLVLSGEEAAGSPFAIKLGPAEFKMFGWLLLFKAIPNVVDKTFTSLMPVNNQIFALLNLAVNLAIAFILLRLILVFPLTALDESQPISKSWGRTNGIVGKLIISMIICVLPLVIMFMAFGVLTAELGPVGFSVFFSVYYVLGGTLVATYLSLVYRFTDRVHKNETTSTSNAGM